VLDVSGIEDGSQVANLAPLSDKNSTVLWYTHIL
jgi:hypothetical protein